MKKTIEYDSDDHVEICSISHGPDQESLARNEKKDAPKRPVLYFVSKYFHPKVDFVKHNKIPEWAVRHIGSLRDVFGLDGVAFYFHSTAYRMGESFQILERIEAMKKQNRAELFFYENDAMEHMKSLGVIT